MSNDWYKLEFTNVEYVRNRNIIDLEKIIFKLLTEPKVLNDVMVFSPKKKDNESTTIWIIPPKTVNIPMIEKILILCGAKKCSPPDINDVSVFKGNNGDIHSFFNDFQ